MRCRQAFGKRRTPEIIAGSGMGQDIDTALNSDFDSLIVGNMGKDRCTTLDPERLPHGKNLRSVHFAAFYETADESRVLEHGRNVKDGREAPSCEHLLELRSDLLGGEFLCVK